MNSRCWLTSLGMFISKCMLIKALINVLRLNETISQLVPIKGFISPGGMVLSKVGQPRGRFFRLNKVAIFGGILFRCLFWGLKAVNLFKFWIGDHYIWKGTARCCQMAYVANPHGSNTGQRTGRTSLKEICHVREGRREFPEFRQNERTFPESVNSLEWRHL